MIHVRRLPAIAGNAACLQQFRDRPEQARALVARPFEATLAPQGPVDLQGIGLDQPGNARFVEIHSGKKNDRPHLARALSEAKRPGTVLLIARLDRLARWSSGVPRCSDLYRTGRFDSLFCGTASSDRRQ